MPGHELSASVSIIVPARNAALWLADQLAALSADLADQGDVEVIVVDNNSRDRTCEIAELWRGYPVKLLRAQRRKGAAYARNVGAAAADGKVLLFCDADDVVHGGWFAAMAKAAERFDVFGGPINGDRLDPLADQPRGLSLPADLDFRPWFIAANIGMSRDAWLCLGGWNERYRAAEEVDLCWRAHIAGLRLGVVENAIVNYRPRSSAIGAAQQGFAWGVAAPRLVADFTRYGFSPRTWRSARQDWVRLIRNARHLVGYARQRRDWLRLAGLLSGRAVGSVRHRSRLL